jgi:2-dehydro-3-deoxy-D-arabinonate dehydratase
MKLARYLTAAGVPGVARIDGEELLPLDLSGGQYRSLFEILEEENPIQTAELLSQGSERIPLDQVAFLPPIDHQEVWAAGVTYKRSRAARMEESTTAASCYDKVYASPRPEIFFKASPHRVSGHEQPLRIRTDSNWNVPEPELALVLNSRAQLVGFTIGNDMSSRDIEGENPLYLPQAKCYDQCCGLGPWITMTDWMPVRDEIGIRMQILRGTQVAFHGETSAAQMARSFENLIGWLKRDNSFPSGAFLLTGTGIVPDSDFTLQPGDIIEIAIDGIGILRNRVVQG